MLRAIIGFGERGQRQDLVSGLYKGGSLCPSVWFGSHVDTRVLNSYDGLISTMYKLFLQRSVRLLHHHAGGAAPPEGVVRVSPSCRRGASLLLLASRRQAQPCPSGRPVEGRPVLAVSPREATAPTPKTKSPRRLLVFTNEN